MLGLKASLNKLQSTEVVYGTFSDHSEIKLDINNKKTCRKFLYILKLRNTLLNNPWVKEEITVNIIKYFELNSNENINTVCQILWEEAEAASTMKYLPCIDGKEEVKNQWPQY